MSESTITVARVQAGLARVHDEIAAAGGSPDTITVLAVTKGFGPIAATTALAAGLVDLGENYAQELLAKAEELGSADADPATSGAVSSGTAAQARPRWHFIGQLQSNKVRALAPIVTHWQSVDRASLVTEIAKRAPGATVSIQVNATGEDHKGGCAVTDVADLVARARDSGLGVAGLMTVGAQGDDGATARAFGVVRDLADDLDLVERSMGMSGDIAAAVAAGTTMVRVGTALFGTRPAR